MESKYLRKFKFFESALVSITVVDYGSVKEKCQYCGHPLRYHYVVDDKQTGQQGRMKVGCECVKMYLRDLGVDEILIERASKVIKKQVAALNHARKFENLDVDKLYDVMQTVLVYSTSNIARMASLMVDKTLSEKYGNDCKWSHNHYEERQKLLSEAKQMPALQMMYDVYASEKYAECKKLWIKKFDSKYRGLSGIYWSCRRDPSRLTKEMLEAYRTKLVAFYLQPLSSPFYFGK